MFLASRLISPLQSRYLAMWRGGAALAVVLGHAVEIFAPRWQRPLAALAGAAVMAFFVISGFFIHKSLARCTHAGVFDWRRFARARLDRIVPPWAVALAVTAALWWLAPLAFATGSRAFARPFDRPAFSLDGWWQSALFVNDLFGPTLSANTPLWSLTFEVWYYVLAALVAMAIGGRRVGWLALPLLLLAAWRDKWFAALGMNWLGGVAVSFLHANRQLPPAPRAPLWIAVAAMFYLVCVAPDALADAASLSFRIVFGAWMVWHLIAILQRDRLPEVPLLARAGAWSYTLYVLHFPLLLFAFGVFPDGGIALALPVLACCALVGPRLERLRLPWPDRRPSPAAPAQRERELQ